MLQGLPAETSRHGSFSSAYRLEEKAACEPSAEEQETLDAWLFSVSMAALLEHEPGRKRTTTAGARRPFEHD